MGVVAQRVESSCVTLVVGGAHPPCALHQFEKENNMATKLEWLELGRDNIENDSGSFWNWLIGDDNKRTMEDDFVEELLPHLLNLSRGIKRDESREDTTNIFDKYVIEFAQECLSDEMERLEAEEKEADKEYYQELFSEESL